MKKTILLFWLLCLAVFSAAQEGAGFGISSIDALITDDVPIGAYAALSSDNIGGSVRVPFAVDRFPFFMPYLQVDNTWWLGSPEYVAWGSQINALLGVSGLMTLKPIARLGTFRVGGGVAYGMMLHVASADPSGAGATTAIFVDQTVAVTLDCRLQLGEGPLSVLLTPRYLFSPEVAGQKHQVGMQLGVGYALGTN